VYLPSSHGVKYCEGSLERLRVFNYDQDGLWFALWPDLQV